MTIWYPDYKLAAGHNNAAGLAVVEGVKPSGDIYAFTYPKSLGTGDPGQRETREDGLDYFAGYLYDEWHYAVMTRIQRNYLRTTYCASGYSGKVTVRTRVDAETYANYNAAIHIPTPRDLGINNQRQKKWLNVVIAFTQMEAL